MRLSGERRIGLSPRMSNFQMRSSSPFLRGGGHNTAWGGKKVKGKDAVFSILRKEKRALTTKKEK